MPDSVSNSVSGSSPLVLPRFDLYDPNQPLNLGGYASDNLFVHTNPYIGLAGFDSNGAPMPDTSSAPTSVMLDPTRSPGFLAARALMQSVAQQYGWNNDGSSTPVSNPATTPASTDSTEEDDDEDDDQPFDGRAAMEQAFAPRDSGGGDNTAPSPNIQPAPLPSTGNGPVSLPTQPTIPETNASSLPSWWNQPVVTPSSPASAAPSMRLFSGDSLDTSLSIATLTPRYSNPPGDTTADASIPGPALASSSGPVFLKPQTPVTETNPPPFSAPYGVTPASLPQPMPAMRLSDAYSQPPTFSLPTQARDSRPVLSTDGPMYEPPIGFEPWPILGSPVQNQSGNSLDGTLRLPDLKLPHWRFPTTRLPHWQTPWSHHGSAPLPTGQGDNTSGASVPATQVPGTAYPPIGAKSTVSPQVSGSYRDQTTQPSIPSTLQPQVPSASADWDPAFSNPRGMRSSVLPSSMQTALPLVPRQQWHVAGSAGERAELQALKAQIDEGTRRFSAAHGNVLSTDFGALPTSGQQRDTMWQGSGATLPAVRQARSLSLPRGGPITLANPARGQLDRSTTPTSRTSQRRVVPRPGLVVPRAIPKAEGYLDSLNDPQRLLTPESLLQVPTHGTPARMYQQAKTFLKVTAPTVTKRLSSGLAELRDIAHNVGPDLLSVKSGLQQLPSVVRHVVKTTLAGIYFDTLAGLDDAKHDEQMRRIDQALGDANGDELWQLAKGLVGGDNGVGATFGRMAYDVTVLHDSKSSQQQRVDALDEYLRLRHGIRQDIVAFSIHHPVQQLMNVSMIGEEMSAEREASLLREATQAEKAAKEAAEVGDFEKQVTQQERAAKLRAKASEIVSGHLILREATKHLAGKILPKAGELMQGELDRRFGEHPGYQQAKGFAARAGKVVAQGTAFANRPLFGSRERIPNVPEVRHVYEQAYPVGEGAAGDNLYPRPNSPEYEHVLAEYRANPEGFRAVLVNELERMSVQLGKDFRSYVDNLEIVPNLKVKGMDAPGAFHIEIGERDVAGRLKQPVRTIKIDPGLLVGSEPFRLKVIAHELVHAIEFDHEHNLFGKNLELTKEYREYVNNISDGDANVIRAREEVYTEETAQFTMLAHYANQSPQMLERVVHYLDSWSSYGARSERTSAAIDAIGQKSPDLAAAIRDSLEYIGNYRQRAHWRLEIPENKYEKYRAAIDRHLKPEIDRVRSEMHYIPNPHAVNPFL